MDEDLTAFLNTSDFTVDAAIGGNTYPCIFDNGYFEIAIGEVGVESNQPTAYMPDVDVAAASVVEGSTVTINSVAYKVVGIKPDGTGMTILVLEAP